MISIHNNDEIITLDEKIILLAFKRIFMKGFFKLLSELAWSLVWLFALLIVGYFVLNWLSQTFSGNAVGGAASWVEQHAQPGY